MNRPDMTLFDLVIVDDEPAILDGLEKTFDWRSLGFRIVGTARNGEAALSLVQEMKPDVVITDIRMKKMDGLTLIDQCRRYDPEILFVILSAHDDFSYAQQACSLGVSSYLLKPVEESQLAQVMSEIYGKCRKARTLAHKNAGDRLFVAEHKREIEEALLKDYLTGVYGESELLLARLRRIESDLADSQDFAVLCIDTGAADLILDGTEVDRRAIVRFCREQLGKTYPVWSFEIAADRTIVIVQDSKTTVSGDAVVRIFVEKITRKVAENNGLRIVVTFGRFHAGFAGLRRSFETAVGCFDYETSEANDRSETRGTRFPLPTPALRYPRGEALHVIRGLRLNRPAAVAQHLRAFDEAVGEPDRSARALCFQRLANEIGHFLIGTTGMDESQKKKLIRYSEYVFRLDNQEMVSVLERILMKIIELRKDVLFGQTGGRYDERVAIILLFIDEHIDDENLSVREAAVRIHLDAAYFGRLFKKVVGMSFHDYVRRRRMETVSELLISTDLSVQEIAGRVGIPDSSYLSTLFKKDTGLSPSDYRNPDR